MGAYQRRKGAVGERDAVHYLQACTGLKVERNARNGVEDAADLVGDGMVFEVKRRKRLAFHEFLRQAGRAVQKDGKLVPESTLRGVLSREDQGQWVLTIPLWQCWILFHAMKEAHETNKARQQMEWSKQISKGTLSSVPALPDGVQLGSASSGTSA